jgi:uncharacterized membrane protein
VLDPHVLLVVILVSVVTYLTRISGYLFLRGRTLSPRLTPVLETAPGCVLITVISPDFVSSNPADLAALRIAVLAATRLPILPTVIIAVGSAAGLRYLIG